MTRCEVHGTDWPDECESCADDADREAANAYRGDYWK